MKFLAVDAVNLEASIKRGGDLWAKLEATLSEDHHAVELTQAESDDLWAYNDSMHRAAQDDPADKNFNITPERHFGVKIVVVQPPTLCADCGKSSTDTVLGPDGAPECKNALHLPSLMQ